MQKYEPNSSDDLDILVTWQMYDTFVKSLKYLRDQSIFHDPHDFWHEAMVTNSTADRGKLMEFYCIISPEEGAQNLCGRFDTIWTFLRHFWAHLFNVEETVQQNQLLPRWGLLTNWIELNSRC